MPRARRLDLAGIAQHVVQRGNNRQPCFHRRVDYLRYQQALLDAAMACGCRIHAYVLMTNHVHLLVTPGETGAVGRMMQRVGRRYVRGLNDAIGRTGTLWEGRYKASLVDNDRYLLACHRYIELNPVRARMVASPGDYPWSSYACHAEGRGDPLVTPHDAFMALGTSDARRREAYRWLVAEGTPREELESIRLYTARQRALGGRSFQMRVASMTGQRAGIGRPGRPRKNAPENLL